MKLNLFCTSTGLKPCYDEDYDEKRKLKVGAYYEAEIKLVRNPDFHRKFFSLINLSWEFLPERQQKGFKNNKDLWRKYLIAASGYVDLFYSPKLKDYVEIPKSICFDKMNEAEFKDLYESVKNVIWSIISRFVAKDEFERLLIEF